MIAYTIINMCYQNEEYVRELGRLYPKAKLSGKGYIYTLQDCRTKEIKYVGRTSDLLHRYMSHCLAQWRSKAMIQWVDSFPCLPKAPIMRLLMICEIKDILTAEYAAYEHLSKFCSLINSQSIIENMKSKQMIELRKEILKETQTAFAERIGKSLRQVQYYEAGTIDIPVHVNKLLQMIEREEKMKKVLK